MHSYTFYGEMRCKPDRAAASKGFKGKGKVLDDSAASKGFKGKRGGVQRKVHLIRLISNAHPPPVSIYITPVGLISIIDLKSAFVKFFSQVFPLYILYSTFCHVFSIKNLTNLKFKCILEYM